MKTCWMKLPSFPEVAHRLRDRFDGASKVIARNDGTSFMTEGLSIKPPTKQDLVYTDESPDFCKPNSKTGSLGEWTKIKIWRFWLKNVETNFQEFKIANATSRQVAKMDATFYAVTMAFNEAWLLWSQTVNAVSFGAVTLSAAYAQKSAKFTLADENFRRSSIPQNFVKPFTSL